MQHFTERRTNGNRQLITVRLKTAPRVYACLQKAFDFEIFVGTVRSAFASPSYSRPSRCFDLRHRVQIIVLRSDSRRVSRFARCLVRLPRLKSRCSLRHEGVDIHHEFNASNRDGQEYNPSSSTSTWNGLPYADGLHASSCAVISSSRYFARPLLPCRPGHAGHGRRPPSCRRGSGEQ